MIEHKGKLYINNVFAIESCVFDCLFFFIILPRTYLPYQLTYIEVGIEKDTFLLLTHGDLLVLGGNINRY